MEAMEPDLPTTSHMSFVDGRCACCPYGFHIDLDFLRYLDSLGRSGDGSENLSNLQMIHQNKKKLRKSMEEFLRRQEMANAAGALKRGGDVEESRRLLSMVEREESVSSKILDEFDSSISEQFSSFVGRSGRKSVDDGQRYHTETRVTLTRPPGVGGTNLTTDYDSSSSVSISSGPPSPGLHRQSLHEVTHVSGLHNLESSRLTPDVSSSVKRDLTTTNGENFLRKMTTTTKTNKSVAAPPSSETVITVDGGIPPGMTLINSSTLHTIREQMAACLQRLKELEEENKALKTLQVNELSVCLFGTCTGVILNL
jgi:hypothetical protein